MSCQIRNGNYYAPNGKESILYKNLEKQVGAERAKELFITAYTKTFENKVIQPLLKSYKERVKNLLPIRKGAEFRQTDVNGIKTTHLYLGKQKIGRIQVENYKDGVKIKSVLVNEKGKGFGTALYNKLIQDSLSQGLSVYSDQFRTEDADRIWESLKNKGLTKGKVVRAVSEDFDANGEISAEKVLEYFENSQSLREPLKPTEIVAIKQSINQDIEDLYDTLRTAFYQGNIFSPTQKSLRASGIYSDYEIGKILEDVNLQATIYSTIQSLKQEENPISIEQFGKEEFKTNTNRLNSIGKLEATNPLKEENLYIEENGGLDYVENQRILLDKYKRIPLLNESGEPIQTEMLYEKAVKVVENKRLFDALQIAIDTPLELDITKLESVITERLKDYGIDISTLSREDYPILFEYLRDPSIENTLALEEAMGFERVAKEKVVVISDKNRSYVYMETNKTEQQLFNELSLIQTDVPNVYHKVNKIDSDEIIAFIKERDGIEGILTELQAYEEYFGYGLSGEIEKIKNKAIANGTFMKAPNGKPTNLSEDNWLFTRTAAFKGWFGDWQSMAKDVEAIKSEGFPYPYFFNNGDTSEREIKDDKGNVEGVLITHSFSGKVKLKHNEFPPSIIAFDKTTNTIFVYDHKYKKGQELKAKNIEDAKKELASILYDYIEDSDPQKTKLGGVFQNIYSDVSKVVDKNGEPLVVNHGTDSKFNEFNVGAESYGIFLTSSKSIALTYGNRIIPSFLNIKNPKYVNSLNSKIWDKIKDGEDTETTDSLIRFIKPENDGIILIEINDTIRGFKEFSDIFIAKNPNQIKSAENTRAQIEQDSNDIRYFKKPSNVEPILIGIQANTEYLQNEFIADFAIEKLKNPNKFNELFKITEKDIELISEDNLTIETVKAHIKEGVEMGKEMAQYSLLSKNIPNLTEGQKASPRIQAVNNYKTIPQVSGKFIRVDNDVLVTNTETAPYVMQGTDLFELQEKDGNLNFYAKLEKNGDLNYYNLTPSAPQEINTSEYKYLQVNDETAPKIKKLVKTEDLGDNFECK